MHVNSVSPGVAAQGLKKQKKEVCWKVHDPSTLGAAQTAAVYRGWSEFFL